MGEPTLAAVPGILVRSFMRFLARLVLTVAWVALLITVSLLGVALLLGTFRTSRTPMQQASASVLRAIVDVTKAFRQKDRRR